MRRWSKPVGAMLAAIVVAAGGAATAATCDEYDPHGPFRMARITLGPSDFVDETRDKMRSFVATGSLGRVEAEILSEAPPAVAAGISATPEISRFSPYYGEALKGVAIAVQVPPGTRPARIVVGLRQVCARYFRNTFLYY